MDTTTEVVPQRQMSIPTGLLDLLHGIIDQWENWPERIPAWSKESGVNTPPLVLTICRMPDGRLRLAGLPMQTLLECAAHNNLPYLNELPECAYLFVDPTLGKEDAPAPAAEADGRPQRKGLRRLWPFG